MMLNFHVGNIAAVPSKRTEAGREPSEPKLEPVEEAEEERERELMMTGVEWVELLGDKVRHAGCNVCLGL
jgi:hypothetical protein